MLISIHAPAKERLQRQLFQIPLFNFNPCSRKGATLSYGHWEVDTVISIHAPAKERRIIDCIILLMFPISIHAPAKERQVSKAEAKKAKEFQSTLPQRSDRLHGTVFPPTGGFQSTLPQRSDSNFTQKFRLSLLLFNMFFSNSFKFNHKIN